ncbi:hypothetical protein N7532_010164 [Penicillium argentinense]|uniref:HNH nuclease domain-containing protein n=1 Tax=Penicillium argentinense TaxID=1131581 RepID=A0A9W9JXN9_9EURO|nr:uncharacterized protein N7532_010164 [Penicillium argentinense]KAJ5085393.1 hypothetical protein N7532_010164 [Penicillium argentinense]
MVELDQRLNSYVPLEPSGGKPSDDTKGFLRLLWTMLPPGGKENLAKDILKGKDGEPRPDDEALRQLVQSIRSGLLIPMKAQGGKTPTEVTPSPRSGVEDSVEDIKGKSIEPISRNPHSKLRKNCLERDGYKCMATHQYSIDHPHPKSARTTYLEAAHIIPYTLGIFQPLDGKDVDRHAKIWINLRRYFPVLRAMSEDLKLINCEENMLMLDSQLHKGFGQFKLIFEATGVPNQYRIKTFTGMPTGPIQNLPKKRLVLFRVHQGHWKLPDPQFLQVHACIGTFLHMSGQGESMDKVINHFRECGGLAPSGSTNIEETLAVSSLSLLPANVEESPESPKPKMKQRPAQEQSQAKSLDYENKRL